MGLTKKVNVDRLGFDIQALSEHGQHQELGPLLTVLKSLVEDAQNDALLKQLVDVFNGMGLGQGVVLTYAPYIRVILSDHIDTLMSHDPYWNKVWGQLIACEPLTSGSTPTSLPPTPRDATHH
jgi:hypothetical protein